MKLSLKKAIPVITFIAVLLIVSCKKEEDTVSPASTGTTTTDAVDIRDSAYYYSLLYYLWNKNLPDYAKWYNSTNGDLIKNSLTTFKPHNFANLDSIMEGSTGIRYYSDKNTSGKNLDRYSFAYSQVDWESTSTGTSLGFGFSRGYWSENDLRVVYVYKNSAIGKAGVKRGWKIQSINGISAIYANESSLSSTISNNNTCTFVFLKPDNTETTMRLTKASYIANFVVQDTVVVKGQNKIGYIVLNSFLGDDDGQSTKTELDNAISNLKATGITDLVIDLRYNGGGYTSVAEYFSNLVAPSSAKGKLMYSYQYNDLLMEYFSSQNYSTKNYFDNNAANFDLSRIVFITSGSTASASELLINNLRPYMNVKLVGTTTYGKPVGFPSILIEMSKTDKTQNYYIFPIAFKTVNANNQTDYYDGFTVDSEREDDFTKDWGDLNEACFGEAAQYLVTGSFLRTSATESAKQVARLKTLNQNVRNEKLSGITEMISTKKTPAVIVR
jgi:C-terminal processing protease CtpA/Prc